MRSARGFFALVVFALAREVTFLDAFRASRDDSRVPPILDDLHAATHEL